MSDTCAVPNPDLKAVVLAAGKEAVAGAEPIMLQTLGDRKVLDYVVQNGLQVVLPENLYIVVVYRQEDVRGHLGPGYHYVVQEEQLGTVHAVLQLYPLLEDFYGGEESLAHFELLLPLVGVVVTGRLSDCDADS